MSRIYFSSIGLRKMVLGRELSRKSEKEDGDWILEARVGLTSAKKELNVLEIS
jgi:hypothetical protein